MKKKRRAAGTPVLKEFGSGKNKVKRYVIRYRVPSSTPGKMIYKQEILDPGLTLTEARKIFAKRLDEAETLRQAAREGGYAGNITFAQIADRYLKERPNLSDSTRERAEIMLRLHILPVLGDLHVSTVGKRQKKITAGQVKSYLESRWRGGDAGVDQSAIRREWSTVRAILNWATRIEAINSNPVNVKAVNQWIVDHLPPNNTRDDVFTPEEWRDFLSAIDDVPLWEAYLTKRKDSGVIRLNESQGRKLGRGGRRPDSLASRRHREQVLACVPVIRMLLYTGSRLSEITSLKWGAVDRRSKDPNEHTITIEQHKTRKPKVLPLSSGMRDVLDSLPEGIGDALIFRHPRRSAKNAKFHHREIQRAMKTMLRVAKLENPELDPDDRDLTPHSIRHTANTWMQECGFSFEIRSDVLGQAVQQINKRYSHASARSLLEAVEAIWKVERYGYPKQVIRLSWGDRSRNRGSSD